MGQETVIYNTVTVFAILELVFCREGVVQWTFIYLKEKKTIAQIAVKEK